MSDKPFVVKSADYHRNGVSGTGFFIGLVEYETGTEDAYVLQVIAIPVQDTTGGTTLSFYDNRGVDVFVTSPEMSVKGNIAFGLASFRGDNYVAEAEAIVREVRRAP